MTGEVQEGKLPWGKEAEALTELWFVVTDSKDIILQLRSPELKFNQLQNDTIDFLKICHPQSRGNIG